MPGRADRVLWASVGLVAYTFVGYPAAMALLAKARPRPPFRDAAHEPSVSLIVAAYDEEDVIVDKLENARALDYPGDRLELIVVADGSADATAERAGSVAGVRVLHEPERRGKLAAMARGAD